jgi:YHS domain-containing protein
MRSNRWFFPGLLVLAVLLVASLAGAEQIERVEAKRVCMVNDAFFAKDQIPVQDDGKTVDKATALVGATPDGKVFYFESDTTFSQFKNRA